MYFTHLLLAAFPSESERTASISPDHIVNRFNLPRKHCSVLPTPEGMNLLDLNDFSTPLNGGGADY
jgi:hypothetical protein